MAALLAIAACAAEDEPADADGPVAIVETFDEVTYYIDCANEPVEINGTTWWPVVDWGDEVTAALHAEIVALERQRPPGAVGFAPRVPPPGPGDSVGTLYVYADGYAYYESVSGLSLWMTTDELEYPWTC